MSIKIVAIDIDGTLVNEAKMVTPKVKEAVTLAKKQGVKIVLCTGRPKTGVLRYLKELNLEEDGDYVITYNGSLVQSSYDGSVISKYTLTYEDFLEIETMSRRLGVHLQTLDENYLYTANRNISPYTVNEAFMTGSKLLYRTVDEMTPEMTIVKMMMIDEPDILDAAIAKIPQSFLDKYTTAKSETFFYEILNKKAGKGPALKALADHLHVTSEEVMAIGDNENDLSMLTYAGVSVAMGNAVSSVKNTAKYITTTNEEDGVAKALEDFVLNT